jgi:hypothetical protein
MLDFIEDLSKILVRYLDLLLDYWLRMYHLTLMKNVSKLFEYLKNTFVSSPIMQPPKWDVPFHIICDASDFVMGAILG